MKKLLAAFAIAVLSACGSEPPVRYETPPAAVPERLGIAYRSISVREVSLPTYAASEEITSGDADGRLVAEAEALWADDPVRAVTLEIARALKDITGARTAPDPWPFQSRPEVSVDVRFADFLPSASGRYSARGLYFIAPEEEDRPEHAHDFSIAVSYDPEGGIGALAAARSQIVNLLAFDIARTALR